MATYDVRQDSDVTILKNLKKNDIINCPYSGLIYSVILPRGKYKLECWGARGGNGYNSRHTSDSGWGGKGAYVSGTINMTKQSEVFLVCGQAGGDTKATCRRKSFNGGGGGQPFQDKDAGYNSFGTGGGGATHIALVNGVLSAVPQPSVIMVAGGGGGGAFIQGTLDHNKANGGAGGLNRGGNGEGSKGPGTGGTQTEGGKRSGTSYGQDGRYGEGGDGSADVIGNNFSATGGGGGWYGGSSGHNANSSNSTSSGGGGGSSYYNPSRIIDFLGYDGKTSMTEPDGSSSTGHDGDGYIRIIALEVYSNAKMKISGSWRRSTSAKAKVDGVWRDVTHGYEKENGVWKKIK